LGETQQLETNARAEIRALLEELPDEDVEVVLTLVRRLGPHGRVRTLADLAGTISKEDAELMRQAIEDEFEKVEEDGW